jgi:hypothetical protein
MSQLSTVFAPTPTNKSLLLSAIAAYELSETRPRQVELEIEDDNSMSRWASMKVTHTLGDIVLL